MNVKLKVTKSPMLRLVHILTVLCILGFLVCTFLAATDLRTEEQKAAEHRQSLMSHSLFETTSECAKLFRQRHPSYTISRISCVGTVRSSAKAALIETNHGTFCYATVQGVWGVETYLEFYDNIASPQFNYYELVIEGDDISILFEEVNK